MSFKTVIFCISVLTFSLCAPRAFANLENNRWVFHYQNKSHEFSLKGNIRGSPMVSLREVSKKFAFSMRYDPLTFEVVLRHNESGRWAILKTYESKVKTNSGIVQLSRRPEFIDLDLCVPIDFGDRILRPLLSGFSNENIKIPNLNLVYDVVLDAGHGGNDLGAVASAIAEKDLTLSLALDLKILLEKRNLRVFLVRDRDVFLTLPERTHLANQSRAKVLISLHLNSDVAKKGKGYEIYVLNIGEGDQEARAAVAVENQHIPKELPEGLERTLSDLLAQSHFEASLKWAKTISKKWEGVGLKPFGKPIKSGPFYVLYGAKMPGLLLEFGFLSNAKEREDLLNPKLRQTLWLEPLADALAEGLKKGIVGP